MKALSKLVKVNESITINRYDNGWMVEVSGKTKHDDWKSAKVMCNTEEQLVALIKEYNTMEIND
jgi:hypothetical protein